MSEMSNIIKRHVFQRALALFGESGKKKSDAALHSSTKFAIGTNTIPELHLALSDIAQEVHVSEEDAAVKLESLLPDDIISQVTIGSGKRNNVVIKLHRDEFIQLIMRGKTARHPAASNQKRLVFDFSSPNIAKPFHVGHLRSTLTGNYLCNLHEWLGYEITRLNYLGDWGTQFGMLKVGFELLNLSEQDINQRPLSASLEAYVASSKAAEENSDIADRARKYFADLENGVEKDVSCWEMFRRCTVEELEKTYSRLGIKFDEYAWESTYAAHTLKDVLSQMERRGLLRTDQEGRTVATLSDGKTIPLVKSDGTSLYLTRDIAAAIDRFEKYKFSGMYYVVDTSQREHFKSLFNLLSGLSLEWAQHLKHIPFGRVRGMSTRKGQVVLLSDVMDEARGLMEKRRQMSPNARCEEDSSLDVPDILGTSAVIVADLIHPRVKDYTFNWEAATSATGNTGVRLQYTHCRLCSLRERSGIVPATHCEPSLLPEPISVKLVLQIARFDEVVQKSLDELEANKLTGYMFELCDTINLAFKQLKVKDEGEIGAQRLLVFEEARTVLHRCMLLLGLRPLKRM